MCANAELYETGEKYKKHTAEARKKRGISGIERRRASERAAKKIHHRLRLYHGSGSREKKRELCVVEESGTNATF